ncbi:RidA family protein [Tsukamurella sp. M9C]|uniref:RidA family protein n=1 Tax=unclassified Tsukamurella TaxID=2633480 RepID=UPI001CCD5144|nr:RidA family protein [Tsukamurella sp. M9C]MCA0155286.1 RidA family protein [Tsukamurella sp. M9C]
MSAAVKTPVAKPAREFFNPGDRARKYYDTLHFATATRYGDLVWVSGQVGIDPATGLPAEGIEAQARHAFEGVRTALEAAGSSLANVIELSTFHTHLSRDSAAFMAVKDEFLAEPYPCWTGVGVTELARPELLVEIRVVAFTDAA